MTKEEIHQIYKEGSIAEIFRLFVKPLFKARPQTMYFKDWLENTIFHTNNRKLLRYRANRNFTVDGYWMVASKVYEPGEHLVKKNEWVYAVHDEQGATTMEILREPSSVIYRMPTKKFMTYVDSGTLRFKRWKRMTVRSTRRWEDNEVAD